MANICIKHIDNVTGTLEVETDEHDVCFLGGEGGVLVHLDGSIAKGTLLTPKEVKRVIRFLEEYADG